MENLRKGKSLYSLWVSEYEEKEIQKIFNKEEVFNLDLALIGAIVWEAYKREDYEKR